MSVTPTPRRTGEPPPTCARAVMSLSHTKPDPRWTCADSRTGTHSHGAPLPITSPACNLSLLDFDIKITKWVYRLLRLEQLPNRPPASKMKKVFCPLILFLIISGICIFWEKVSQYLPEQSPCALEHCLFVNDTLAIHHLRKFPQPFLSRNYNLSEEDFNWWKLIRPERRNINDYRKNVERVFELIPDKAPLEASITGRCRTCALVGNSRNLLKSHYGPFIDFQDCVLRINRGHSKGFEADVGNRTTHQIMYPESSSQLDHTTRPVLFAFKIRDFGWITKVLSKQPSGKKPLFNKDLAMVVNPAFMRNIHHVWLQKKGAYASTGFMALVLALHICDEVHVFGFGADSDGNWSHYWEKIPNRKIRTGRHPGNVEYKMIEELAKHQIVTFYRGW
ncbi:CMP-N-acetylneuraminate-beta-galactosamide-alpha-2,3-sialyltransferase 1-like isoform 2-T2 [Spinachia spinachia]